MASRSVALVNRLRLGESPTAADCAVAVRLLAVDAAAGDFVELTEDLVQVAGSDSNARKLRIRLALLADSGDVLDDTITAFLPALTRYFNLRADVDSSSDGGVDDDDADDSEPGDATDSMAAAEPAVPATPVTGALADLAVPARVSEALVAALSGLVDDCRRFRSGLDDVLSAEPDTDIMLDFLSAAEADLVHALTTALRSDFTEGQVSWRSSLRELAGQALASS